MPKKTTLLALGCGIVVAVAVNGLAPSLSPTSRRIFLRQPLSFAAAVTGGAVSGHAIAHAGDCWSGSSMAPVVAAAQAYERRDVGGASRSSEQAAYNEQAYETNNRLEKAGLKLDTQAEQKTSLSAALSDYAYPGTSSNKPGSSTGARKQTKK